MSSGVEAMNSAPSPKSARHCTTRRHLRGPEVAPAAIILFVLLAACERAEAFWGRGASADEAPISAPFHVKLRRERKASPEGVERSFYVATAVIGEPEPGLQPQRFDVVFDLGSGQVVLPSSRCHSKTCAEHRRYDKWASKKAVDINANGHPVLEQAEQTTTRKAALRQSRAPSESSPMHGKKVVRDLANIGVDFLDLGSGQVRGELIRDRFCLAAEGDAEPRCLELGLVVATEMSELPFSQMPNDGIVGLGLEGLTIGRDFGFLTKFSDRLAGSSDGERQFGLFLGVGPDAGGEIVFGGYDSSRLAVPDSLVWTPVANPEKGFWQVAVMAVRVGGKSLPLCSDAECRGAVETGASHFSLSDELGLVVEDALREAGDGAEQAEVVGADGDVLVSKRQRGYGDGLVNVEIVLEGGGVLTLRPEDYLTSPDCKAKPETCKPLIERHTIPDPVGRGLFVLGENVLRRYCTVFDWGEKRIGFGLSKDALAAELAADAALLKAQAKAGSTSDSPTTPMTSPQPLVESTTRTPKKGFLGSAQPSTILLLQVKASMKTTV